MILMELIWLVLYLVSIVGSILCRWNVFGRNVRGWEGSHLKQILRTQFLLSLVSCRSTDMDFDSFYWILKKQRK